MSTAACFLTDPPTMSAGWELESSLGGGFGRPDVSDIA
jgi:hypothetical protein